MAPSPQENVTVNETAKESSSRPWTGDEVVISGMSGIYPKSESTKEFMENLYNKVDMVSDVVDRWELTHPEVPKHLGMVKNMSKFDAQFFRVHYKQACTMEPMSRKLLEHAYSAIFDSGINPLQLRGKKVGVFIGATFSESEKIVIYETVQRNGFGITGCNRSMYANRISYWIDGKGPSYSLDSACASSMACLEHAYRSISTGQCDAAIIGGCNLCMHPYVSLNMRRAGYLCLDGKTKVFDKHGDGYVRADAMCTLFLQKAKDARRIYSEVYYAKASYSKAPSPQFLPIRESDDIENFLRQFYSEIDVSPSEVEYIEASGAATAKADGNELDAIGRVFGNNRTVKVGCVKSNMGHSEPASGACALTKVCLAYHKGQLPANLHYNEPQDHIPAIRDGSIEVLKDHSTFNRGFAALNAFSYSGVNIHVLLKGHYKPKDLEKYKTSIPRIVLLSGRQESCVKSIINHLEKEPVDAEVVGMLHNIHKYDIPGHMCRGYVIIDTNEQNETVCLTKEMAYFSETTRPLWFVYSGMGSQWVGMGAELMKIPIFAAAIHKCHQVLEPKGIDIVHILTEPDKKIYDNILNCFVGIAAVQIGLTDVLRELGIVPDNLIGHSVGELGCAYADGCFTAEEMILAAYSRGLVSLNTQLIRGSMAAVGLGYEKVKDLLPTQIEVACHNSSESSTISGPADIMKEFVAELAAKGVFAKEVPCSNIAYHSRYIADAGPGLLEYLNEVIKDPKPRSKKWVSTSVPQDKWDQPLSKFSSAEYHTNNLLSPVLFEETAKLIPENAILIEVAPHGLLQAILKRSMSGCVHIPLTRRGHSNPLQFFLEALGKLYTEGLHPQVESLYPKIQYPVSTETGLLSQLVQWEHSENWPEAKYNVKERTYTTRRNVVISIHDDDFKYLENYVRDGYIVFPEAAQILLVWETLAMHKGVHYSDLSVKFTNISFHNEAHVHKDEPIRLTLMILKGSNHFEVSQNENKIMSGVIEELDVKDKTQSNTTTNDIVDGDIVLNTEDVYKILQLRGHHYSDNFQTIQSITSEFDAAHIGWNNEWTPFLDSLIQLNMLAKKNDGVSVLKLIKKLTIDTEQFKKEIEANQNVLKAEYNQISFITSCAGVELTSVEFSEQSKPEEDADVLTSGSFVPHFIIGQVDAERSLLINLQIVGDSVKKNNVKVIDIDSGAAYITNKLRNVVDKIPTIEFDITTITDTTANNNVDIVRKADLLLMYNLLGDEKKMKNIHNVLSDSKFILTIEENYSVNDKIDQYYNVISSMGFEKKTVILLNKANVVQNENIIHIPIVHDVKFSWVQKIISELQNPRRVVLVSEKQPYCGLLGMVKRLNTEFDNKIGLVMIDDVNAPSFNPDDEFYKKQLQKNLTINVLKKGHWGGYYNLPTSQVAAVENIKLISVPGYIDSLKWEEVPVTSFKTTTVQVQYAGPTFRDAQIAVGKVKSRNNGYGQDFSGLNSRGERVMGLLSGGAIASTVEADTDLLWPVPEHWSLEEAATVPLAYIHAYYCLAIKTGGVKHMKIFIMGGCGAFGQALIALSLSLKWTVYTTVRDNEKKQFLLKMFPQLEEKNIGSSYDDTFYTMVIQNSKAATAGIGCNFVINCLSSDMRNSAMKCVGFGGIFLDVSETDMENNADFGMFYLCEERNYISVKLSSLFKPENVGERKLLQLYLSQGIQQGFVRPLSRVVYSPNDITRAFRLLSSSKHRGKVLIRLSDSAGSKLGLNIRPRITYSETNTYIVVCDETEIGIELVDHIVKNGAKKVVINLPNIALSAYFFRKLVSWKQNKASIIVSKDNLQTEMGCINLFNEAANLGLIDTIFMVQNSKQVDDTVNQRTITENFSKTALVVGYLDKISRNVCPTLSNFVVLMESPKSLVSEYTTSVSERICLSRSEVGLPALTLKYWWSNENKQYRQTEFKVQPQNLQTIFNSMEAGMKLGYNNVVSFNLRKNVMTDFLRKVARILDVKNINDIEENITLHALGINDVKIEELRVLLKNTQQIDYPADKILDMTINSFKQINQSTQVSKSINGLDAFYTFIDQDECMATEPMVAMPTILSNALEQEEELVPSAKYLMLIPGFEGHQQIFTSICERLKIRAMTFQLGTDINADSIREIAVGIMKFMKKKFELKSKFYILGYSFGVDVALELAALMEEEGHVGVVYCLDSSPDALRVQIDAFVGNLSDTELQDTIVKHMFRLMTDENSDELADDLKRLETWPDKVNACVSRLRGVVSYSNQYKRSILETAYKRIQLARTYKPDLKLNSEIILMKGIPHPLAQNLPQDYNLSMYTNKPIVIYDLESEHPLTPFDCRVSNIVNKMLEPQVIEEFKSKNLCESYLADPLKSW